MNKDQWYNVLEFSRTVHADLSNYDEDGACKYIIVFSYENIVLKTIKWEHEFVYHYHKEFKLRNRSSCFNCVVSVGEAGIEGRELRLSTIIKSVLIIEIFSVTW